MLFTMTVLSTPSLPVLQPRFGRHLQKLLLWRARERLSLPLAQNLEMPLVIAHVTWAALRREDGWGLALSTGRQCRKLHRWCSSCYLLPLLDGVEMMGREGRRTYLGAYRHQVACLKINVIPWGTEEQGWVALVPDWLDALVLAGEEEHSFYTHAHTLNE
jgi:hypothetical protein